MSPVVILIAAWLLVLGYGLVFIGWKSWGGAQVSFSDAFGLSGKGPIRTGAKATA